MRNLFVTTAAGCALSVACLASAASAQTPPAAPSWPVGVGPGSAQSPTYISIPMEVMVNKPAAEVWKRVGKFCDIAEWLQAGNCTITAGKDGEVGAVRSVGGEVLVAKTELSYTYTQTSAYQARPGRGGVVAPYNLYHGTLEARPVTATTTKLIYTLFFDNSMLADDAAREADRVSKAMRFTGALNNMKILAEGGTLPPPPARGGAGGGGRGAGGGTPAGAPPGR